LHADRPRHLLTSPHQLKENVMSNTFDAIRQALSEARDIQKAADTNASQMAAMITGRLRHVPPWILKDLKRELRDFNLQTGYWKELK